MKKLLVFLFTGIVLLSAGKTYAQQTTDTGSAVSGAAVTTCANLTGVVCNSASPLEPISPTPVPGGNYVVGGGGGGGSSSCGDTKPNGVTNLIAIAGPGANEVTLSWLPPTGAPYTGFLVAYSDSPAEQKWGNPDIGNVTRFTVSALGSGTYYFWIAAVNRCKPGDLVGPVTAGSGAVFASYAQAVVPVSPTPTPEKTIKGAEEVISAVCTTCVWWPFLVLEILALILYAYTIARKKNIRNLWIVLFSIPILTYILFLLFNGSCAKSIFDINAESFFCRYFYLLDAVIFIIYLIVKLMWTRKYLKKTS